MRSLWARIVVALCMLAPGVAGAGGSDVTVLGVRLGGDQAQTRLVVESDRGIGSKVLAREPALNRIVVSLPSVDVGASKDGSPLEGAGVGLVKAWRITKAPAGARLELDLAGAGAISRRFALPPASPGGPWRYVIDVAAPPGGAGEADSRRASTLVADHAASPAGFQDRRLVVSARTAPKGRRSHPKPKVIVVDAGHGGHDPGARSGAYDEKDITLAAALAVRRRLERDGRYKVVMTRESDVFVPLESRVQIARRAGADLFISLHADSAGGDPDTHGASVYTLSDHGETRVTEVLGPREWFARNGSRGGDPAVGGILLDLTQRSTLNRSAVFAGLLIDRIGDKIDLLPRTHRDAGYFVLLAPDVPAVLLEMGFISSPRDQARLTDPSQRAQLAGAIGDAIDAYFGGSMQVAERS